MKNKWIEKENRRQRQKRRIRKKVKGTAERPRLSVCRGTQHMEVQVVDDIARHTLFSVNSRMVEAKLKSTVKNRKVAIGEVLGKYVAEKLKERNIDKVVFDRGGFRYHGRVKAVAEGAREGGLEF